MIRLLNYGDQKSLWQFNKIKDIIQYYNTGTDFKIFPIWSDPELVTLIFGSEVETRSYNQHIYIISNLCLVAGVSMWTCFTEKFNLMIHNNEHDNEWINNNGYIFWKRIKQYKRDLNIV